MCPELHFTDIGILYEIVDKAEFASLNIALIRDSFKGNMNDGTAEIKQSHFFKER
jgi:hypothetical protein